MQANPSTADDSFLVVTCFRTRVMLASFLRVVKHAMERKGIENITELTREVASWEREGAKVLNVYCLFCLNTVRLLSQTYYNDIKFEPLFVF